MSQLPFSRPLLAFSSNPYSSPRRPSDLGAQALMPSACPLFPPSSSATALVVTSEGWPTLLGSHRNQQRHHWLSFAQLLVLFSRFGMWTTLFQGVCAAASLTLLAWAVLFQGSLFQGAALPVFFQRPVRISLPQHKPFIKVNSFLMYCYVV